MNIVYVIPGPSYNISSSAFQLKYKCLSDFFSGYILTTSGAPESKKIGKFDCIACKYGIGIYSNIKFLLFCIKQAWNIKRQNVKIDLIVTYDPIKTGVIGCLLKLLLQAKLAVEVNGVYSSPVVWESANGEKSSIVKKWLFPRIIRPVLQYADGVKLLFPTQIDAFHITSRKKVIVVYYNWVNTELFYNYESNKEILFVGFPFKIKGVDILIRAFKLIAEKYPDWRLKILGWYPDMQELNTEIDGHCQISYHPPVASSEIPEHIGRCGFFVLPSRTEAMGRVLVEAMAAGKARIGMRVDGIPTVINDGVDGLLVEPENVEELAKKMELLITDPVLREKLGNAACARAKKEFTSDAYLRATFEFYNQVMSD